MTTATAECVEIRHTAMCQVRRQDNARMYQSALELVRTGFNDETKRILLHIATAEKREDLAEFVREMPDGLHGDGLDAMHANHQLSWFIESEARRLNECLRTCCKGSHE